MSNDSRTSDPMEPSLAHDRRSVVPAWAGVALCFLLASAQIALGGYQMGVGNQAIQVAFLKHWAEPWLYSSDPMVTQTMPAYPSYFFRLLAPLLHVMSVDTLYLSLQFLTSFLTLSSVYWLARSIFRSHATGIGAVALLVAGHLHALAGDSLYSIGFTHTFAALPMAVAALALAFRGRWIWAFLVAGLLFNLHALTAAYALLMLCAAMLADVRDLKRADWLTRLALCLSVTLAAISPTLALMVSNHQVFNDEWINLMRIRSADHSFPSTWWASGDADIPQYLLLLALFVLSWSFTPLRRGSSSGGARRAAHMIALMTAAVLGLFLIGYVFSDGVIPIPYWLSSFYPFELKYYYLHVEPIPLIIRLQPFRASRLLMILMIVHIAHGAISAIRAGVAGETPLENGIMSRLQPGARVAEIISGNLILLTLGIPFLLPLLPVTVLAAMAAGLIAGHLSWRQAAVATAILLVVLLAALQTGYMLPPLAAILALALVLIAGHLSRRQAILLACALLGILLATWQMGLLQPLLAAGDSMRPSKPANQQAANIRLLAAVILAAAALLTGLHGALTRRRAQVGLTLATLMLGSLFAGILYSRESTLELSPEDAALKDVADWARTQTPPQALFLTPRGLSNFRITAERSIVGDWRDGTQLYFSADFGPGWLQRTQDLEPGFTLSQDGKRLISRGGSINDLSDDDLVALAKQYGADYIILPNPPKGAPPRALVPEGRPFASYSVFKPEILVQDKPIPPGVINVANWNKAEEFMQGTVARNIEEYRKVDVTFTVVDPDGRPVKNLPIDVNQTRLGFNFGVSLGFFERNYISPEGDEKPEPVTEAEKQKAPEIFNASMIPFSSKWCYIEPNKGEYHWSDLDKYVDYAVKHNWTLEFHHLTGIPPEWVFAMGGTRSQTGLNFPAPIPALQTEFNRHCYDTVARYADRIKYWQVVNEKYMMQYVPPVMKELQKRYPDDQFGISDCVRFWDGTSNGLVVMTGNGRSGSRGGRGGPARGIDDVAWKGADAVDWLIKQGVKPDFFSIHGHWPLGLWADPRDMYDVIDYFADRKVRVHISEMFLQLNSPVYGPLRSGISWTPKLQGEYLSRWLTVAYSHPDVDMVNYWGLSPNGWGASNSGLIDSAGRPNAAWDILKKQLAEWKSHASGELLLDGSYIAPLHRGTYAVTLTLPSGKTSSASVTLPELPKDVTKVDYKHVAVRLELEPDGTLKPLP